MSPKIYNSYKSTSILLFWQKKGTLVMIVSNNYIFIYNLQKRKIRSEFYETSSIPDAIRILHNSLNLSNGAWLTLAIKISHVTWFKSERCLYSRFLQLYSTNLASYLLNWLLSTKQLSILRFGGWCNKLLSPRKTMFWGIQPKFLWRKLSRPCGKDLLIGCCWMIGIIGVAWPNKIIKKI